MRITLAEKRPELVGQWSEKNFPLAPDQVTYGSNLLVWWKGSCGHEWQACIKNRANGAGCPICSGHKVLEGVNDLQTLFPKIALQWSEKNKKKPNEVAAFTNLRVWWKCENGHEWFARVADRATGHGCPYCCGNRFETGINDLKTLYPDAAVMWNGKNLYLKPSMVSPRSTEMVWWECPVCGYEWQEVIHTMTKNIGCPVCEGRRVVKGINDLATTDPVLAKEWYGERNDRTPFNVKRDHQWTVWWKGSCGHEWRARIYDRAVKQEGCKVCEKEYQKWLPVLLMTFYARKLELRLLLHNTDTIGIVLETYLPDILLAVEFYEESTREGKQREQVKQYLCRKRGITLVKITEWDSAENLVRMISEAFSKADLFFRTDATADLAEIRTRYFLWKSEFNHDSDIDF